MMKSRILIREKTVAYAADDDDTFFSPQLQILSACIVGGIHLSIPIVHRIAVSKNSTYARLHEKLGSWSSRALFRLQRPHTAYLPTSTALRGFSSTSSLPFPQTPTSYKSFPQTRSDYHYISIKLNLPSNPLHKNQSLPLLLLLSKITMSSPTTVEIFTNTLARNIAISTNPAHELNILETEIPEPGPRECLVHVRATGICGSDVHFWKQGRIGSSVIERECGLGHESAGVVIKTGREVEGLRVGMVFFLSLIVQGVLTSMADGE